MSAKQNSKVIKLLEVAIKLNLNSNRIATDNHINFLCFIMLASIPSGTDRPRTYIQTES